jgi:hypothetical protein
MKQINRHCIVAANMSYKENSEYFYIESLEDGLQVKLSVNECEYSLDGKVWINLSSATNTTAVNTGEKIYFRGNLTPTSSNGIGTFTISKKCNLKGNIMSLLYGDDFIDKKDLGEKPYAFYKLFSNCKIVDASELSLSPIILSESCYRDMFKGCAFLTKAPYLPATTLTNYCYNWMFYGCTSLMEVPELPATTLASNCYNSMFYNCTNLVIAPQILAQELKEECCSEMFKGCTSLTEAPELLADTLSDYCYYSMFEGCTSLIKSPKLPATTLANYCYQNMFKGCTSLTEAPELLADTLSDYCYHSMFAGCTSLTESPELLATNLAIYCYYYMFRGCTSLTKAPSILPATTLTNYCYSYMFELCNSLKTSPEMLCLTLSPRCCQYMFRNCTNLNKITMLATDISATGCLTNWVQGVASSGTFVKHPDMTTLPRGNNGIPNGWTVEEINNYDYR